MDFQFVAAGKKNVMTETFITESKRELYIADIREWR